MAFGINSEHRQLEFFDKMRPEADGHQPELKGFPQGHLKPFRRISCRSSEYRNNLNPRPGFIFTDAPNVKSLVI